jgi:hypothetical protein
MEIFGIWFGTSLAIIGILLAVVALALPVLWLWMLIDALLRQEWEYPGATPASNNRVVWVLLIAFVQVPAVLYFFMVFQKARRGSIPCPPWAACEAPFTPAVPVSE